MSTFIRSALVFLVTVLSVGLAGKAEGATYFLPGTIYDQDKHFSQSGSWCNWYYDPDNSGYQPGDPIDNTIDPANPPPGWRREDDLSCWMATAANMLQYVGGADMYQTWAYNQGAWSQGELRYWNRGGFPGQALYLAGYPTSEPIDNNGIWSNPQGIINLIRDNLADAMPVGIGVFNAGMRHAITVVGIDTTAHTLTVTDSDNGQHNVTETFSYTVTGNQVQLGYAGGSAIYSYASFLMMPWYGSGTLGDTSTSGPTTLWSNWENWIGNYYDLTKIHFSNPGLLSADTSVTGLKLLLKGDLTTINVTASGSLTWEMLQNSGAHINLTGGTLAVHKDFFHSGTLDIGAGSLFGAGNVYMGSSFSGMGQITQTGGTASMNTIIVGQDAGFNGSTVTVQGGSFSAGDLTVGQKGVGFYDQQGGTVNIVNLIAFGWDAGSSGSGTLSGGYFHGYDMVLGNAGDAAFNQTGGVLDISDALVLGESLGSNGSYNLTGFSQLTADWLIVGSAGGGTFTQNSLTSVVADTLEIATDHNASYVLHAGTLTVGSMNLGRGVGAMGSFIQNQGLVTVSGNVKIATSSACSNGAYTMSHGTLSAQNIYLGDKGVGTFTQTGGAVAVSGTLTIGNEETASGHYRLDGGIDGATVTAAHLVLGEWSLFEHYRGTVTLSSDLTLAGSSAPIYELHDGTLSAPQEYIGDLNQQGTFLQTGGTNNVSGNLILGNGAWSSGTYTISGNSTLTVGHDLDITGSFNLNGGLVSVDWIALFSGSTFSSSGSPYLKVNRLWGFPTNFDFNGNLFFGHSGGSSSSNYEVASGSSLTVSESLIVGFNKLSSFTQTGGVVVSSSLTVGRFAGGIGTYNLSATGSLITDEEFIGSYGQGNFNQLAGTHTVNGPLHLANEASSVGTFHMSGGSLIADELDLAAGSFTSATFIQDGGHSTLVDGLKMASSKTTAYGIYQLIQGTLTTTGPEYIGETGTGEFYQFGGTHHWQMVPAAMYIGYNGSATGKYTISGGTLNAGTGKIYVGHNGHGTLEIHGVGLVTVDELVLGGTGTFTSTGGTLRVNKLTGFGNSPSFGCGLQIGHLAGAGQGSYSIVSGQSLSAHDLTVGYNAPGNFTQNGGADTITAYLILGNQAAGNGTYTLGSTGIVSALYQRIGSHGSGTFTQNGGSNTVGANLYLGEFAGSQGIYHFNGGNLTAHDLTAGCQGAGTMNQTAGTVALSSYLILGEQLGGQGAYTLGGTGAISAPYQRIGCNGTGTFTHNAGGNTAGLNMYIGEYAGSHGTYNLNGGSLSVGDMFIGSGDTGEFNWNGGSFSAGSIWLYSHGTMTSSHDWIYGKMLMVRGGTLDLSGHVMALESFSPAPVANGAMTDGHILATDAYIGSMGQGAFTQSGGDFSLDDSLFVAAGPAATGQFTLSGGTVTANKEHIAYQGTGSMSQTSGTNRVFADLYLGTSSGSHGTYELKGFGASLTATNVRVGHGGSGHFTHSLGNAGISGTLSLGNESSSSGTYELGPAYLQVNTLQIGVSGFGIFTQEDGVNNVGSGGLSLGKQANSMGRYELHGGSLTVAGPTIIQGRGIRGDHRIVQTGGAAHYNDGLVISDQTWGGSSRYELRGGKAWVTGDLVCNAQGHLALGGVLGIMAVSDNVIFNGGSLDVELGADNVISHLAVNAGGANAVTLNSPAFTLALGTGYTPGASAQIWTLIDPTDPSTTIAGIFAGLPEGTQFNLGGRVLTLSYVGGLQHNDLVLTAAALPAATAIWMGSNSLWESATNWVPNAVPDWTGTIVIFGDPGSNPTVDLQATGRTVGQIIFHNNVATTIQGDAPTPTHGGGTLTLDNNAAGVTISVSGQHTISALVSLKSNVSITVNGMEDSLSLSGNIGEAVEGIGITKLGSGPLLLQGICSYTGGTTISDGTLVLSSTGQIDIASSIVNNATFQLDGGTHAVGAISGSGTMEVLSGNLSATSIVQDVLNNDGITVITNGGNITSIIGSGVLTISGDTFTAGSIVQGSLNIGSIGGLSIGSRDATGPASIPEPSTFVLLGIGVISLFSYAWRWRREM